MADLKLANNVGRADARALQTWWSSRGHVYLDAPLEPPFREGRFSVWLQRAAPFTVFEEVIARGLPYDHYRSDLYIADSRAAREILARHREKIRPFTDSIDGDPWLEVPFAYDIFWQKSGR